MVILDFRTLNLLFRCVKEFSHEKIHMKDLSDTECMLCSYILSEPGCTQEEVSAALKADKTTVAKALASLESKGCISRIQDPADKRRKRLNVTVTGREKISGLADIHNTWLSEILKCLSPEEQKQFENYCTRLLEAAEELAAKQKTEDRKNAQ